MNDEQTPTDEQLKQRLTPEQYSVTQLCSTEPAFTGKLLNNKEPGVYRCICCGAELFSSQAKYDSGSGWPSYTSPLDSQHVETRPDHSGGVERTEVVCRQCKAHLGHVFEDGPAPTGLRYCINSAALTFERREGPTKDG